MAGSSNAHGESAQPQSAAYTHMANTGKLRKRGAGATTITLSISMEDKELAKKLAAECNASVSDMLHKWICQECRKRKKETYGI